MRTFRLSFSFSNEKEIEFHFHKEIGLWEEQKMKKLDTTPEELILRVKEKADPNAQYTEVIRIFCEFFPPQVTPFKIRKKTLKALTGAAELYVYTKNKALRELAAFALFIQIRQVIRTQLRTRFVRGIFTEDDWVNETVGNILLCLDKGKYDFSRGSFLTYVLNAAQHVHTKLCNDTKADRYFATDPSILAVMSGEGDATQPENCVVDAVVLRQAYRYNRSLRRFLAWLAANLPEESKAAVIKEMLACVELHDIPPADSEVLSWLSDHSDYLPYNYKTIAREVLSFHRRMFLRQEGETDGE